MKLLDELKTVQGERVVGRCKLLVNWSENDPATMTSMDHQYKLETKAEFFFVQQGPKDAFEAMHRRAVKAVARDVYGEIQSDLCDLLEKLWEEGYHPQDEVLRMVNNIIQKCEGSK